MHAKNLHRKSPANLQLIAPNMSPGRTSCSSATTMALARSLDTTKPLQLLARTKLIRPAHTCPLRRRFVAITTRSLALRRLPKRLATMMMTLPQIKPPENLSDPIRYNPIRSDELGAADAAQCPIQSSAKRCGRRRQRGRGRCCASIRRGPAERRRRRLTWADFGGPLAAAARRKSVLRGGLDKRRLDTTERLVRVGGR